MRTVRSPGLRDHRDGRWHAVVDSLVSDDRGASVMRASGSRWFSWLVSTPRACRAWMPPRIR